MMDDSDYMGLIVRLKRMARGDVLDLCLEAERRLNQARTSAAPKPKGLAPKRDRAAYMRDYRRRKRP